jgi:hypothetical protein
LATHAVSASPGVGEGDCRQGVRLGVVVTLDRLAGPVE